MKFEKDKLCSACQADKQVTNTHPTKAFMSTTRVLELLQMDLFGPTTYKSLGENLYCLVIVDDYSRYTWVFFLHDKSKVASCFKKFTKRAQNKFEVKLKKIKSDNRKEFDNTNIEAYCDEVGIKHEVSVWGIHPRVPQDGTWAAPSEVVRPVRSRCARQDYKLY